MNDRKELQQTSYWETHYQPVCENMARTERLQAYNEIAQLHQRKWLRQAKPMNTTFCYAKAKQAVNPAYRIPESWILVTEEFVKKNNLWNEATIVDPTRKYYSIEWKLFISIVDPTNNELKALVGIKDSYNNCSLTLKRRMMEREIEEYEPMPPSYEFIPSKEPESRYQKIMKSKYITTRNRAIKFLNINIGFVEKIISYFDYINNVFTTQAFKFSNLKANIYILIDLCIDWDPIKKTILLEIKDEIFNTKRINYTRPADYYLDIEKEFQKILEVVDIVKIYEFGEQMKDLLKRYMELENPD